MDELRTAILAGDNKHDQNPDLREEQGRRQKGDGANLIEVVVPRVVRRRANQRQASRFNGVVKRAAIIFRRRNSDGVRNSETVFS